MTAREPKRVQCRIGYMVVAAMTVAAGLGACGRENASDRGSDGPGRAQSAGQISAPEQLLEWMADHPESAGLVVAPDGGSGSVDFGGDRRFPLASTRKVLVLGALTASGEGLQGRVPQAEIERYTAPAQTAAPTSEPASTARARH